VDRTRQSGTATKMLKSDPPKRVGPKFVRLGKRGSPCALLAHLTLNTQPLPPKTVTLCPRRLVCPGFPIGSQLRREGRCECAKCELTTWPQLKIEGPPLRSRDSRCLTVEQVPCSFTCPRIHEARLSKGKSKSVSRKGRSRKLPMLTSISGWSKFSCMSYCHKL
jgi:hypothetical protein